MCGISGVISVGLINDADSSVVKKMNQRLIHRGPNSDGVFATDHAILAMRRLSIIDLAGGDQPLFNEEHDIALVCNGEIYNHRQLREELEALGHRFTSRSDSETIIHAYEEYGINCLAKLRGMFAFALWDGKNKKLFLARDRMGEKPLYYHQDGDGHLWFSSEMNSLTVAIKKSLQMTPEAFNLFMAFQYIPEPMTPIDGVAVVPAGCYLELSPNALDVEAKTYWDLSGVYEDVSNPVATTEQILENACLLMGSADVPVAVALSGGIDSSLVAALTARHYPGQLHAFTIGYKGRPDNDERSFAATLAKELGIGFTGIELETKDIIDGFPALVAAMDTPIGDIAAFGYYSVCKAARAAGYPVLLSGLGGDEFFWGYEWVREAVTRNEALLAGKTIKRSWWKRLFPKKSEQKPDFFGIHPDLCNGDEWSRSIMLPAARSKLSVGYWLDQASLDLNQPMHLAVSNLLNRTWLRSNCLALADRMSMAHSVEMRLPLLDIELVSRVTGMRNNGFVDWNKPHKWLLTEALKDVLPADILKRKKQGFTPPVRHWMAGIVKYYGPLIEDGALVRQGLVDPNKVRGGVSGFNLTFLYKLVLLEVWTRLHIEGQSVEDLFSKKAF